MIETKQLVYFIKAAECRSFSETAKKLYTTQSNVSKVIASLEEQLGRPLFIRTSSGIRLSVFGTEFYEQAVPITAAIENLYHI